MQIIKTLGVTALALLVAGSVVSAAPANKYTFIHLDSKGHEKVLTLDCAGVLTHFSDHPGEQCFEENWEAFVACSPV
jgi:hypothetical protein